MMLLSRTFYSARLKQEQMVIRSLAMISSTNSYQLLARVRPTKPFVQQKCTSTIEGPVKEKLLLKLDLEVRGHDKAVLDSYSSFVKTVCEHLEIECGGVVAPKYVRWVQCALRSKFVRKKYKLHYETRTHIRQIMISHVTGSTANTFLEYIQRNIPEGVAMKIVKEEILPLPDTIGNVENITEGNSKIDCN